MLQELYHIFHQSFPTSGFDQNGYEVKFGLQTIRPYNVEMKVEKLVWIREYEKGANVKGLLPKRRQ